MASKLEERVSRHDREIAAIRKIILTGMKVIVKNDQRHERHFLRMEGAQFELQQSQLAFREELNAIAGAGRETSEQLQLLAAEGRETRRELRALSAEVRQLQKNVDTLVRTIGRGGNGRH